MTTTTAQTPAQVLEDMIRNRDAIDATQRVAADGTISYPRRWDHGYRDALDAFIPALSIAIESAA